MIKKRIFLYSIFLFFIFIVSTFLLYRTLNTNIYQEFYFEKVSGIEDSIQLIFYEDDLPVFSGHNNSERAFLCGYFHAYTRTFQMDFIYSLVSGNTVEKYGDKYVLLEKFVASYLEISENLIIPDYEKSMIKKYMEGVNKFLSRRKYPISFDCVHFKPELWSIDKAAKIWKLYHYLLFLKADIHSFFDEITLQNSLRDNIELKELIQFIFKLSYLNLDNRSSFLKTGIYPLYDGFNIPSNIIPYYYQSRLELSVIGSYFSVGYLSDSLVLIKNSGINLLQEAYYENTDSIEMLCNSINGLEENYGLFFNDNMFYFQDSILNKHSISFKMPNDNFIRFLNSTNNIWCHKKDSLSIILKSEQILLKDTIDYSDIQRIHKLSEPYCSLWERYQFFNKVNFIWNKILYPFNGFVNNIQEIFMYIVQKYSYDNNNNLPDLGQVSNGDVVSMVEDSCLIDILPSFDQNTLLQPDSLFHFYFKNFNIYSYNMDLFLNSPFSLIYFRKIKFPGFLMKFNSGQGQFCYLSGLSEDPAFPTYKNSLLNWKYLEWNSISRSGKNKLLTISFCPK